jgi:hypothetical protein
MNHALLSSLSTQLRIVDQTNLFNREAYDKEHKALKESFVRCVSFLPCNHRVNILHSSAANTGRTGSAFGTTVETGIGRLACSSGCQFQGMRLKPRFNGRTRRIFPLLNMVRDLWQVYLSLAERTGA